MKNKKTWLWLFGTLAVFTLMVFSFSTALALEIKPWAITGEGTIGAYKLPAGTTAGIIAMITTWLLGVFAFFGVIGFVVSGIMYLVSAGDDDMISKAKKYMMYSIVGVIVGLSGYVIIQAVENMLWGDTSVF